MKKLLKNEYGLGVNLALATVLIAVAMSAMVSLVDIIQDDRNTVNWTKDKLQQELFLRSENRRINFIQEKSFPIWQRSGRTIEMATRDRIAVFYIELYSSGEDQHTVTSPIGPTVQVTKVEAWCFTRHSRRFGPTYSYVSKDSPVVSYIYKLSRRSSLAQYQYFSHREISDLTNDANHSSAIVRFDGRDVLWGPVHSNDNIYSVFLNGGWPVFHGKVTTAGELRAFTGGASWRPHNESEKTTIFQGGFEEGVAPIIYEPTAIDIRRNGATPIGVNENAFDIAYCIITDGRVDIYTANFIPRTLTFDIHSTFPDNANATTIATPIGPIIGQNIISYPDTNWSSGQNVTNPGSIWLPTTVWVRGRVSGARSIGALDAYTAGHITYSNTTPGTAPDADGNFNRTDYFGLVSEGSIRIKYKYKDNEKKLRWFPNSSGPGGRVFLYGAYSAQGVADPSLGNFAYKTEGVFSYEYQHPHGAPIDFTMPIPGAFPPRDTTHTFIAFRRLKYPPLTIPNPQPSPAAWPNYWPGVSQQGVHNGFPNVNTSAAQGFYTMYDHPRNNPVWPEWDRGAGNTIPENALPQFQNTLVYQRGTLSVYGSIAQRRRGFMNRSGTLREDNPDTQQFWNIDNFVFGGPHSSTGYEKDYHFDRRFLHIQPPDYPEVYHGSAAGRLSAYEETSWNFKVPPPRRRGL